MDDLFCSFKKKCNQRPQSWRRSAISFSLYRFSLFLWVDICAQVDTECAAHEESAVAKTGVKFHIHFQVYVSQKTILYRDSSAIKKIRKSVCCNVSYSVREIHSQNSSSMAALTRHEQGGHQQILLIRWKWYEPTSKQQIIGNYQQRRKGNQMKPLVGYLILNTQS